MSIDPQSITHGVHIEDFGWWRFRKLGRRRWDDDDLHPPFFRHDDDDDDSESALCAVGLDRHQRSDIERERRRRRMQNRIRSMIKCPLLHTRLLVLHLLYYYKILNQRGVRLHWNAPTMMTLHFVKVFEHFQSKISMLIKLSQPPAWKQSPCYEYNRKWPRSAAAADINCYLNEPPKLCSVCVDFCCCCRCSSARDHNSNESLSTFCYLDHAVEAVP